MEKLRCVKRECCRCCGSSHFDEIFSYGHVPIGDHYVTKANIFSEQSTYPLRLYRCQKCNHIQLLDVIDANILYGHFTYRTKLSTSLVQHFQEYCDEITRRGLASVGTKVLDIGSNDGTLLSFFKQNGCTVFGVEPASDIAREAVRDGIPTCASFFDEGLVSAILSSQGLFDLVTVNNTFSNVDNASIFLKSISQILSDQGTLVIETLYAPDLVMNKLYDVVYHEHLSYYSLADFEYILPKHGMFVHDVQRSLSKGGSIRVFVRKSPRPLPESNELLALREYERSQGTGTFYFWDNFRVGITILKRDLQNLFENIIARDAVIVGYGASVGVTPIIYSLGLQRYLKFLVDDNLIKQDTFSPGFRIPVYSPERLLSERVDYILVLAWRYASQIMIKNAEYAKSGGKYIVPVPEIRVY